MVIFGEKAKIKKAGNLNYGRSNVITTVLMIDLYNANLWKFEEPYLLMMIWSIKNLERENLLKTFLLTTPSILAIICDKNVGAKVVCGFFQSYTYQVL